MASLSFEVDTTPMARTVDSVSGHVTGVTAAVTAMEAAVIATERKASKTICDNVDNGFYVLMKSQISQKAVAAYSEMTSKQMTLIQLVKALDNVRCQMESDYNMIARRYTKLFTSLNKALETRVRELDRPAMQLAEIRKSLVFDKLKNESALLLSSSGEIVQVEETALNGKLKQKTQETLKTLFSSVGDSETYNKKVDSILNSANAVPLESVSEFYYLPALFMATESLLNREEQIESVYTTQSQDWQNTVPVVSEVNQASDSMGWKPSTDEERNLVRKEFVNLCEKETLSNERLSKEILRLFDRSAWEDLRK
jgi:hypothetical protein